MTSLICNPAVIAALDALDAQIVRNNEIIAKLNDNMIVMAQTRQKLRWHVAEKIFVEKLQAISKKHIKKRDKK